MKWKRAWNLVKTTVDEFMKDRALRLGAALAYYSIFSIAPLVIIVIAVAGFFLGEGAVRDQIVQQLRDWVGDNGTQAIVSMVGAHKQGNSLVATIIGIVALLFGASGVFGQLQDSLNVIWGVQPKPGVGVGSFIRSRFLSFAMVLGIGFLLLISMLLSTFLSALTGAFGHYLTIPPWVAEVLNFAVSFGVITLLFGMIFKVLPDAKVQWRDVWMGALFTALLFTIGKYLLGLYLGRATVASSYGAAGSLVVLLLWVYYSSLILFFGAEFTKVYAKARGARIIPTEQAVAISPEARADQGMPTKEQVEQAARKVPAAAPISARAAETESPKKVFEQVLAQAAWESVPTSGEIVRQKPWPYLGLALGLGLATGWLLKGDFHQRRGFFQLQR
jgi:membrane protein